MAGVCPRITTYPPVGSVTVLEPGQTEVSFTVIIEWERDRAYPFSAKLLYSDAAKARGTHSSSWQEAPLPRSSDSPSRVFSAEQACRHASFTATLTTEELSLTPREDGSLHLKFAIQYQHYPGSPFKELNTSAGLNNSCGTAPVGEVVIPAAKPDITSLEKFLTLEDGWTASSLEVKYREATAWRVTAQDTLPPSEAEDVVLTNKTIGRIIDQLRFMCIVRAEPFWYGAVHDGEYFHLSEHAILATFMTKSGLYVSLLSFNATDDFYQVFTGGPDGAIDLAGRNDSPSSAALGFLVAVAVDRQASIEEVMRQARSQVETTPKMQLMLEKCLAAGGHPKDNTDFYDNLGYCTWNGIGQDLTQEKLLAGLDKLAAAGVVFNNLIIDDNWQTLGNTKLDPSEPGWRGWARFEANEEGFSNGLGGAIAEIKRRHPHIQYVGVWHAILGYWAGLSHDAELAKKYKTRMTRCKVRLSIATDVLIIDPEDVHRMYDDFYAYLRTQGVDFVKTDVQHLLSMFLDPKDRQDVPTAYQSAWTAAYLKHFEGKAIGCMSQIPQITFHSLLQRKTPKILVRNNDDFFPEIPGSHPLHIFTNAHNALLTQHLNMLPDWDMFQTSHAYSSYHGAARAISGGPVLITDTPGEHDVDLINAMTATTPSGRQIALRPGVATALDFFDSFASGPILKVAAAGSGQAGIIGCFNAAMGEREAVVPYSDFQRVSKSEKKLVVRSFRSKQIFVFETPLSKLVKIRLAPREWDILTATPVINTGVEKTPVAMLGLLDKMSGAAAMHWIHTSDVDNSIVVHVKALGRLGLLFFQPFNKVIGAMTVGKDGEKIGEEHISSEEQAGGSTLVTLDLTGWWKQKERKTDAEILGVGIQFQAS